MTALRDLLEREAKRISASSHDLESTLARASRRDRRRRVATAVVIMLPLLVVGALMLRASDRSASQPAQPDPSPNVEPKRLQPSIVGLDGVVEDLPVSLPADASGLAISPDGLTVAFVTSDTTLGFCGGCGPGTRIATVALDGLGSGYLTDSSRSPVSQPKWSPDGTRVAFVSARGGSAEIWTVSSEEGIMGPGPERVTSNTTDDSNPTWSPDGSTILFDNSGSQPLDENLLSPTSEIWSVAARGGQPDRLTRNRASDRAPSVSPDGRVVFSRDVDLWILDPGSGKATPLPGGEEGWAPAWSPDGTKIAFLVYEGRREFVVDVWDLDLAAQYLPVLSVVVLDVETGERIDLGVGVATARDVVSWMPSGDALLVNLVE